MSGDFPVSFLNSIFINHQGLEKPEYATCFDQDFKWQRSKSNLLLPLSFYVAEAGLELTMLPKLVLTFWLSSFLGTPSFWLDVLLKASFLHVDLTWCKGEGSLPPTLVGALTPCRQDSVPCLMQAWKVSLLYACRSTNPMQDSDPRAKAPLSNIATLKL